MLLLSLLEEADRYGYEIIRELDKRSNKVFQFKEGTLYPVLHKLENKGYVRSYVKRGETGKERKYYKITEKGQKQLVEEKKKWELFSLAVNRVAGGEVHAFA